MARSEIKDLSKKLLATQLNFVPRGEQELEHVYRLVRETYPTLCDDTYLCAENCSSGHRQPEWKHAVRRVLAHLKSSGVMVTRGGRRGLWVFR